MRCLFVIIQDERAAILAQLLVKDIEGHVIRCLAAGSLSHILMVLGVIVHIREEIVQILRLILIILNLPNR